MPDTLPQDDKHEEHDKSEEFDPLSPEFATDPYAYADRLRHLGPVSRNSRLGCWVVTGREEIMEVLGDAATYTSTKIMDMPVPPSPELLKVLEESGFPWPPSLVNTDPPQHTRIRALFTKALTARRIDALEPAIQRIADELIDGFAADGRVDLMSRFAYHLPLSVIADLVGVPRADIEQIKSWTMDWLSLLQLLPADRALAAARSVIEYHRYYAALIAERRAEPRDDLLTALLHTEIDGRRFDDREIISHLMVLLNAGYETTYTLIGNLMFALLSDPAQHELLKADPRLIHAAIEETMRHSSPVKMTSRHTTRDVRLAGHDIEQGARVYLILSTANRDPAGWPEPDRFDIRRESPARHLGFGHGIHYCIGAMLAKREARIAHETLTRRLPGLRLAPGDGPAFLPHVFFRMLRTLDLEWDGRGA